MKLFRRDAETGAGTGTSGLAGFTLLACTGVVLAIGCADQQTMTVTATAYNSISGQTDSNPTEAAWGDELMPGMKAIAVSPDLVAAGLALIVAALGRSDTDTQGTPHEVAPPNVTLGSETFKRLWNVAHGRDPDPGNRW